MDCLDGFGTNHTHAHAHNVVVERERERVGFPVSPTNELIPHADTEHRIRRTRELQRTNAIGADEDASYSATHRQNGRREQSCNLATCVNRLFGQVYSGIRCF